MTLKSHDSTVRARTNCSAPGRGSAGEIFLARPSWALIAVSPTLPSESLRTGASWRISTLRLEEIGWRPRPLVKTIRSGGLLDLRTLQNQGEGL